MAQATFFLQECPTCGRRLQVRIAYLGKEVSCQHCRGSFIASEPGLRISAGHSNSEDLIRRADELLAATQRAPHH